MCTSQFEALDAFDRGHGTGSASAEDDFLEQSSIFHNEWGSSAATTFNPADTDAKGNDISEEKQRKFEDLYQLHNGKMEKLRKQDIRDSHVANDAATFVSVLEMTGPQRARVQRILEKLDISSNNFGGRRYEKIILSICSLVSDEALSERYSSDDDVQIFDKRLLNKDEFEELMQVTGMSGTEHRKIREQIRQKSDYFE
jgi:hypothetical protein